MFRRLHFVSNSNGMTAAVNNIIYYKITTKKKKNRLYLCVMDMQRELATGDNIAELTEYAEEHYNKYF